MNDDDGSDRVGSIQTEECVIIFIIMFIYIFWLSRSFPRRPHGSIETIFNGRRTLLVREFGYTRRQAL